MFEFFQLSLSPDNPKYQTHLCSPLARNLSSQVLTSLAALTCTFLFPQLHETARSSARSRCPLTTSSCLGRSCRCHGEAQSRALGSSRCIFSLVRRPAAWATVWCFYGDFFFNFHPEFLVVLDGRFRLAQAGASWPEVEFLRHDIFLPSSLCRGRWYFSH